MGRVEEESHDGSHVLSLSKRRKGDRQQTLERTRREEDGPCRRRNREGGRERERREERDVFLATELPGWL